MASSRRRYEPPGVAHNLYVKVVTGADADHKSSSITVGVLKYIQTRLPALRSMGISVRVNTVRSQDLQNPRLVEAMRKRGITRLPALATPNDVYIGLKEITGVYERNLRAFADSRERPDEEEAGDDALDSFYRDEMSFERADEDVEEAGLGEGDNMMDSYRHMMERRESSSERRPGRPGAGAAAAGPAPRGPRGAAPRPPGAAPRPPGVARPDNLAQGGHGLAQGGHDLASASEDAEIQETIDRLARDIDDGMRNLAFSTGGGDSLDDDGGADPQDDLMERAYWGNMSES